MTRLIFTAGIFILLLSFFGKTHVNAAPSVTLSKNEIEHGDFFEIYGSDFGSGSSEFSFVCFGSTSVCISGSKLIARSGFEWTNTKIRMALPSFGIPIAGEIIVVGEEISTSCTAGICHSTRISVDKGRAQYTIKPTITTTLPATTGKPGDMITVVGNGFGDTRGELLFDDVIGTITKWSYKSIEVQIPSSVGKSTKTILVRSQNSAMTTTSFIVTIPLSRDEYSHEQYYLEQIGVPPLWKKQEQQDVVVAVLDDGVYQNHPDLQQNIWKNTDEIAGNKLDDDANGYVDDHLGYNFWDNSAAVDPKGGHGTAVAGVIAAIRDNGIGIAGIASRAKIMSIIISDGQAVSFDAIKKGVDYAVDNGANIINISAASLGTVGFTEMLTPTFQRAFEKGVLLVVAAGNRDLQGGIGQNLNLIPESPVCNTGGQRILLGVAALNNADGPSEGRIKAIWSSYGRNCVNISAPGVRIKSTTPPAFQKEKKFYDILDGTSFSAPIVSGVAALMKSIEPSLRNWEIINRIIASSESLDRANAGFEGQIGGRVDAAAALSGPYQHPQILKIDEKEIEAGGRIKVTVDHYLSSYSFRLSDQHSIDAQIPVDAVTVRAADMLDVKIPSAIDEGLYRLRIVSSVGTDLVSSSQQLAIRKPPEMPIALQQEVAQQQPPEPRIVRSFQEPQQLFPLSATATGKLNEKLVRRLSGLILLQIEDAGQSWYLAPSTKMRYFLGRPHDAFQVMKKLGLGVTHQTIRTIPYPKRLIGRIIIDVQDGGKAYYINPRDGRAYFLGRPADAFAIMRQLGLGITNRDIEGIPRAP